MLRIAEPISMADSNRSDGSQFEAGWRSSIDIAGKHRSGPVRCDAFPHARPARQYRGRHIAKHQEDLRRRAREGRLKA